MAALEEDGATATCPSDRPGRRAKSGGSLLKLLPAFMSALSNKMGFDPLTLSDRPTTNPKRRRRMFFRKKDPKEIRLIDGRIVVVLKRRRAHG